jgi:uncharacterized protein with PQ loop repeat
MSTELLTTAYAIAGAMGIAAFLPQAYALWVDKSGSRNVPLTTWGVWGAQTIVYVMYAVFVVRDVPFIIITTATFTATHICLWLLVYNRFFRKLPRNRRATDPKPVELTPGDHY